MAQIKRALTREMILGMQVINSEGNIIGKVKELSLVVGDSDQALIIEGNGGEETIIRWSEVSAVGDVVLVRPESFNIETEKSSTPASCRSCGSPLKEGDLFCPDCGKKTI